jgi:four helix bundle protein
MQRYTDLKVWQRGHELVLAIYRLTEGYPKTEQYGVVSQLRRAAVSVPTNIAEGSKRTGRAEYARFLNVAEGSLAEADYLLLLSRDLGLAGSEAVDPLRAEAEELSRMIHALRRKVEEAP